MKANQQGFSAVETHDQLPQLTVTQEQLDALQEEVFGPANDPRAVSFIDPDAQKWSDLLDRYYQQRVVYVRSNETLLLRFQYDYEVDLDRINSEADLLGWTSHLCEKTWMTTERLLKSIEAAGQIKELNVFSDGF